MALLQTQIETIEKRLVEIENEEQKLTQEKQQLSKELRQLNIFRRDLKGRENFPPGFRPHFRNCGDERFSKYWELIFESEDQEERWTFKEDTKEDEMRSFAWRLYDMAQAIMSVGAK